MLENRPVFATFLGLGIAVVIGIVAWMVHSWLLFIALCIMAGVAMSVPRRLRREEIERRSLRRLRREDGEPED